MEHTEKWKYQKIRMDFLSRESFILLSILFIGFQIVTAGSNTQEYQGSVFEVGNRYCDFSSSDKIYNISDLLLCMNELASAAVIHSRKIRSSEGEGLHLANSRRETPYAAYQSQRYQYPLRTGNEYPSYYENKPNPYFQGGFYTQGDQSGYYSGGSRYPYAPEQGFNFPGGPGAGLFDALTSISQYDDLKCVPRLLCEAATGVIPGSSGYKQSYGDFGTNSLIRLLTALDISESSPLLTFGKSALTGYASRGNPSVCYREYPRCPRNNADLVNYLNNHNGGFFRFFGNVRGTSPPVNYYRGIPRGEPAPPPGLSGPEADRTGTGELKFDNLPPLLRRDFSKNFFPERREHNETDKVTFPQEPLQGEQSLNRVSKSLIGYQKNGNGYQSPSFFPQDRKDQDSNMLYASTSGLQFPQDQNSVHSSRTIGSPKAKLYLPDDPTNETMSTFTFPDGQKVPINVGFSKLFSEGYKKALRRSFANDHSPQPVNFEGFSMVNLAELYPNDRSRMDLQVVHPCDMICHDSKGTPVQFNQILLHSGSLSTLMAPDQPILDLSIPVPCELMCIDRRGERRRLSTALNQVLRTGSERANQPDGMNLQANWENRDYRSLDRSQNPGNLKNRENESQKRFTRHFPNGENIYRRPNLNEKFDGQQYKYSSSNIAVSNADRKTMSQSFRQLRAPKIREAGETEGKAKGGNANDKAASMPQGSIMFGGGPIPFFGGPVPFMTLSEIPQGSSAFIPQGPLPLGLAMQSMPSLPMQPEGGIIQTMGMMPMFPGILPIMDPLFGGLVGMTPITPPPSIICYPPTCPDAPQSPARILMLCGGILYFIPPGIAVPLPICAISMDTSETSEGGNQGTSSSSNLTSEDVRENQSSRPSKTGRPEAVSVTPSATMHPFRQPEGEDYPQQSCLENESWNLDMNECVPIKYDKDIETDYTHLPGSPWSGVTRKPFRTHKFKKRKKLVIITDKGNITYIKAI